MKLALLALVMMFCTCLDAAVPLGPGVHLNCETTEPGVKYALRIPKDYAESQRPLPVLFAFGSAGSPPGGSAEDWAEQNGLITVSTEGIVSAPNQAALEKNAAAVTAALEKSGLRIHPTLRYAFGFSAGGMAAAAMARADAKHFSGVALLAHSGNGVMVPKNIAVAFYAGRSDTTHRFETISRTADAYRSQGNLVKFVTHEGGHEGAPGSAYVELLDWLLLSTCLSSPALTAEDRTAGVALVQKRIDALGADAVPAQRIPGCRALLQVAGVAASPSGKSLRQLWATSASAAAQAPSAEPLAAHNLLVDTLLDPLMATFDDKTLKSALTQGMQDLRKDKAVAQDWSARQACMATQVREVKATSKGAIREIAEAYAAIAKRFPDSPWGAKAKTSAETWAAKLGK